LAIRKIPMRMCVGCRTMIPKADLLRVVKTPEGKITFDTTGKLNGRGAYVCKNAECLAKIKKQNSLSNAFKEKVSDEVYESLEKEFRSLE